MSSLGDLLVDRGTIIGGVPGTVVRYAGSIIREQEKRNALVAERIDLERRLMHASGLTAYHAGRIAGHESNGSGAR